jgi:hypothetical protein
MVWHYAWRQVANKREAGVTATKIALAAVADGMNLVKFYSCRTGWEN